MIHKTKTFHEERVVEKPSGAVSDEWIPVRQSESVDQQVSLWVDQTQNLIVCSSAPAIDIRWLDQSMTVRSIMLSVVVVYVVKEDKGEQPAAEPHEWPEYRPSGPPK